MASMREQRQQETHFKVMRLLRDNPSITTREIAKEIGISNGAAYYCITALIEKGFVKLSNFAGSPHKSKYMYTLTPKGIRQKAIMTTAFLERKLEEFDDLKREIEQLEREAGIRFEEEGE